MEEEEDEESEGEEGEEEEEKRTVIVRDPLTEVRGKTSN